MVLRPNAVQCIRQATAAFARRPGPWLLVVAVVGLVVWNYFDAVSGLVHRWWNEPDYLYGFLVPVFSGYLLWTRRELATFEPVKGIWWGLPLIALAAAMRWASAYYYYELLDPMSLVPCLAGLTLFLGGWRALRWAWPAIVFLVFMVPLPGFIAGTLSHPLQRIGTLASTYVIQTIGLPCTSRGNVIVLATGQVGVVEACNGLRMMMLFVAVSAGAALVIEGGFLRKTVVVLSAIPIAVIANVARITVTSVLHEWVSHDLADKLFHDVAGFFMMPLAVGLLWLELGLISTLTIEEPDEPMVLSLNAETKKKAKKPRPRPRGHAGAR